jgi:hypothetical protein
MWCVREWIEDKLNVSVANVKEYLLELWQILACVGNLSKKLVNVDTIVPQDS